MKIFAYPRDWNPYQDLLYGAMQDKVQVFYGKNYPYIGPFLFVLLAIAYRLYGCRIAHIHWQALALSLPLIGEQANRRLSLGYYKFCYRLLDVLGYRIAWTVHNVLPHEPQTSDDKTVARVLAELSSAKIVHSAYTLKQMQELGINTGRTHIIPHGNYDGVYPVHQTREQAREILGVQPNEQVLLFFGNIRAYKGLPELLEAYRASRTSTSRLVIAGKCSDETLNTLILAAAENDKSILYHNRRIPDVDVASYFLAADAVCLPFKSITTSGSIILAATFGKPLIAPKLGAIKDIPSDAGIFYNPKDARALQKSIRQTLQDKAQLQQMSQASAAYAASLSWERIAQETYVVYQSILERENHA